MSNIKKQQKQSYSTKMKRYFRALSLELKKVTWPQKKELVNYTGIVITISIILAMFMGVFDFFFKQILLNWI